MRLTRPRPIQIGLTLCLASAAFACHRVAIVLAHARPKTPVVFDVGMSLPDLSGPSQWTNEYCGSCHREAFDTWKLSRHAHSGLSHNFSVEVLEHQGGRRQHCINCHAPRNNAAIRFATAEPEGLDEAYLHSAEWVQDGVDCLTCHVREGHVLVAKHSDKAAAAHPIRVAPEIASAEFCAGCHQFAFKSDVLPDGYFGQLQQSSFEEFLDYQHEHGESDCLTCHMPGGSHAMPGGYDNEMLRSALDLDLKMTSSQGSLTIEVTVAAGYVGHRIPGGEHFRYLTLVTNFIGESEPLVEGFPRVEELRRPMDAFEQGDPNAVPQKDTRLEPGESRKFTYQVDVELLAEKEPWQVEAALWYHFMPIEKAKIMGHTTEEIRKRILRKTVKF